MYPLYLPSGSRPVVFDATYGTQQPLLTGCFSIPTSLHAQEHTQKAIAAAFYSLIPWAGQVFVSCHLECVCGGVLSNAPYLDLPLYGILRE